MDNAWCSLRHLDTLGLMAFAVPKAVMKVNEGPSCAGERNVVPFSKRSDTKMCQTLKYHKFHHDHRYRAVMVTLFVLGCTSKATAAPAKIILDGDIDQCDLLGDAELDLLTETKARGCTFYYSRIDPEGRLMSEEQWKRARKYLLKEKLIEQSGRGSYFLTDSGLDVAKSMLPPE
jgi:hypothetical protein